MRKNILYLFLILFALKISRVDAHNAPIAEFTPVSGICFGDSSKFINLSTGGTRNLWVIQSLDTLLHDTLTIDTLYTYDLTYYFPAQGLYLVTLREDNGHVVSITKEISIGNSTKANFDFQLCTNQFLNLSTCATSFHWEFGDGDTSNIDLPIHQYPDTGKYTVMLIVDNGVTSDTSTKQIIISGSVGFPNPIFQVNVSNDTVFCKITGGIWMAANVAWYFGDNTTATSPDTFHVFQDTGSYYVRLRDINYCGQFIKDTTISILYSTSINEHHFTQNIFSIFPNPSQSEITFQSKTNERITAIEVYDLIGEKMTLQPSPVSRVIDVSQLPIGQYILQITTMASIGHIRFVKN